MFKIPRDSKILSISHNDLDGVGSQIVLGNVFENIIFVNSGFYNLDEKLETLNYDKYDYVIITDVHPENKNLLYLSDKIILIDHHPSDMNSPKHNHHVLNKGVCATTLVKHYVEKMHDIKLTHLDEFVRLVNDYDMWELTDPRSKNLNDLLFGMYQMVKFRKEFMNGKVDFNETELAWLEDYEDRFQKTYAKLDVFDFENINACICNAGHFINEISHNLMEDENYDIVFIRNPNTERVSVRSDNDDVNLGKILEEFGYGGGHAAAAGMFCSDLEDFQKKVGVLEETMYDRIESIRKESN